jgi:uncharacterized membrane protein
MLAGRARYILFAVGLLPSVLYQIASVSGDAILFGLTLLFIGWLARAFQEEIVSIVTMRALSALSLALAFTKPTYFWIGWASLAILFRPLPMTYVAKVILAIFIIVGPILAHAFLIVKGIQAAPIAPGIDPDANWQDTLHHPLKFVVMLLRAPEAYPFGTRWNLWQSIIGKLGWLDAPLPTILYPILTLSVVLSAQTGNVRLPRAARAFLFTLALISVCVVALPIRIYAMPGPSDVMFGLAGRYFIPTLSILLLASNLSVFDPIVLVVRRWVLAWALIGSAAGAWAIAVRYYG